MYSSQAEESRIRVSEAVPAVTVVLPPGHTLGHAAEFGHGPWSLQSEAAFKRVDQELLPRAQLQFLAKMFGNDNLKLGGYGYSFHCMVTIRTLYRYSSRMST